ncbi:MAG: hypothetical protein AMJ65_14695 [Phycisphaerae bacterium SG8_4]|nr:MAG: hypothetical protein AMJ65_14695 [Phycisphaerae bacterium SG8_4]
MAKVVCTIVLVAMLNVLVGCQEPGPERARLVPTDDTRPLNVAPPAGTSEADIVEEMAINREAYRKSLEMLIGYYNRTGNNMKLERAQKELREFQLMTKYNYIMEPVLTSDRLKATTPVAAADDLYYDGLAFEKSAVLIPGLPRNENKLRLALQSYNRLIKEHPTSDKIDDAAYKAGVIMEEFKDYVVALDYYQSAYKWDPETIHPARFRAARILDKQLHRYAEALELYQEAIRIEARFDKYRQWKEFAETRITDIQKLDEGEL